MTAAGNRRHWPLCANALEFFRSCRMGSKEILCHLLLGRIALRRADVDTARLHCDAALRRLEAVEAPHLMYQAHVLVAQTEESAGDVRKAAAWYQSACSKAESLRDVLRDEELKIAFMKNKLEVYESLIALCPKMDDRCEARSIFDWMEQAKSRTLRDLMGSGPPEHEAGGAESAPASRIRELREELNWYYHRIEIEQLSGETPLETRLAPLETAARDREKALVRLLRDMPASQAAQAGMRLRAGPHPRYRSRRPGSGHRSGGVLLRARPTHRRRHIGRRFGSAAAMSQIARGPADPAAAIPTL